MSASAANIPELEKPALGVAIRARRHIKRMSLQQLSAACGLSVAMISLIERDLAIPTANSLQRICKALGMPLDWLNEVTTAPEGMGPIVRRNERRKLYLPAIKMYKELMSPDTVPQVQLMRVVIQPGGVSGPLYNHPEGAKCGLVQSGTLGLQINDDTYEVEAGDTFAFDANKMHRIWCVGDEPVELLWIATPAVY